MVKKKIFTLVLAMMPLLAAAVNERATIGGLVFDCFDQYGTGTCRFSADFDGSASTYSGKIVIPSTVNYGGKTYTVTRIGSNVFMNSNVTSVYIPSTITAFDSNAFYGGKSITSIISELTNPVTINNELMFSGINSSCVLVVPQGYKSVYASKNWSKYIKGGTYENAWIKADDKSKVYGDANPTLTYSYASLETLVGTPTMSSSATKESAVGNYQISINNKAGIVSSGIATFVDGTLSVTKAPLTVTAKSYTITQGDALPTFEATYSGFKNGETSSVLTTQPSFSCSATSSSTVGTFDIIVSGAAANNYSITYVKGTLTINPGTSTLAPVDLGLPSGKLWANMNVGANAIEDAGDAFAWGETATKTEYTKDNYIYGTTGTVMSKYNSEDGLTSLKPTDDAATINCGSEWRTPTLEEWRELNSNCTRSWTTINGVKGYKFTGKNGNSVFLPCGFERGGTGYYWSATRNTNREYGAWNADFDSGGFYIDSNDPDNADHRRVNRSIRPIYDTSRSIYGCLTVTGTGSSQNIDIDGNTTIGFELNAPLTGRVTFSRSFTKDVKATICLPFDVSAEKAAELGTFYKFVGLKGGTTNIVTMQEVSGGLTANTAYIFNPTSDFAVIDFGTKTIAAGVSPVSPSNTAFAFQGTYNYLTWSEGDDEVANGVYGFALSGFESEGFTAGQFVRLGGSATVRPFRCYLKYNGDLSGTEVYTRGAQTNGLPNVIGIEWVSNGNTTSITSTRPDDSDNSHFFTLDGHKLLGKPSTKGIYICNGHKVVIK